MEKENINSTLETFLKININVCSRQKIALPFFLIMSLTATQELTALTSETDCDPTAIGLPHVTSATLFVAR
jgi:hypothetical protein